MEPADQLSAPLDARARATSLTPGRAAVAAVGLTVAFASLAPHWVTTTRPLTGYGSLRIVGGGTAWDGYFGGLLPMAVGALGLAGLLALVLIARPGLARRLPERAAFLVLGGIAFLALVAAFIVGPGGAWRTGIDWSVATPGPLAMAGLGLAGVPLLVALVGGSGPSSARFVVLPAIVALGALALVVGLDPARAVPPPETAAGPIPDWRTDPREPYPFTTPIPPLAATAVDGIFDRDLTDHYQGVRAKCVRCPPYPLDKGRSQLTLREGRFTITHVEPRYESGGHFTLNGRHLILFNDPECSGVRAVYNWSFGDDGILHLRPIADPCAFGQRQRDLTDETWHLRRSLQVGRWGYCDPPDEEAAVTGHWPRPSGC